MPDIHDLHNAVLDLKDSVEAWRGEHNRLNEALQEMELKAEKAGLSSTISMVSARTLFKQAQIAEAIERVAAGHPALLKAASWDGVPVDYRLDDVSPYLRDLLRVASLLPQSATESPTVAVFRASAAADQAAVTAAGELKPASSPGWQEVTIPVVTIAHVTTVDNALLADVEQTRSVIDQEMVAGLIAAENQELLNGSGAGHIAGLLASAAATPVTITAGEPVAEALHRGLTTLRVEAFSEPDGIVLHPADLEALRFAKATGSGVYLAGDPLEADAARLWGVPIVATTRIAEGTALVGSFAVAARLYVRQAPVVEMSPFAGESFQRNLVMLRCEERIGLGVVRPQALCSVDLIGSET